MMLADAGETAVLALAPAAVMLADAGAPAVLAGALLAVMLADAGAPAVLAGALLAVMLADAGSPAVLAPASAAVMLADAGAPQSLQVILQRLCPQMLVSPLSGASLAPVCEHTQPRQHEHAMATQDIWWVTRTGD